MDMDMEMDIVQEPPVLDLRKVTGAEVENFLEFAANMRGAQRGNLNNMLTNKSPDNAIDKVLGIERGVTTRSRRGKTNEPLSMLVNNKSAPQTSNLFAPKSTPPSTGFGFSAPPRDDYGFNQFSGPRPGFDRDRAAVDPHANRRGAAGNFSSVSPFGGVGMSQYGGDGSGNCTSLDKVITTGIIGGVCAYQGDQALNLSLIHI